MIKDKPILSVQNLTVNFDAPDGRVGAAVDEVSFEVFPGKTLALVGESGCGKSMTALSILGLIPSTGEIGNGTIQFEKINLLDLDSSDLYPIRGNQISMIFQEPMTSLNPVLTIGRQLTEALVFHHKLPINEAEQKILQMLDRVHIPEPRTRLKQYPHQMSGGMRQRIMIAMALSCSPKVLIADEPTTALDVTIQAQILDLMIELQEEFNTAIILITHDLGVVAEMADQVAVMYSGKVVEEAPVISFFNNALHPYSRGLMNSLPRLDSSSTNNAPERLIEMPGVVPSIFSRPKGCSFAPRCPLVTNKCLSVEPPFEKKQHDHYVACWEIKRSA